MNVSGYVPFVPDAGVPPKTPVDALNVTPEGKVPVSVSVGCGEPVAVTTKVLKASTTKVALAGLVMEGA